MSNESKVYHITQIMKLLEEVDDPGTMEYLYTFIKKFIEKWGGCH